MGKKHITIYILWSCGLTGILHHHLHTICKGAVVFRPRPVPPQSHGAWWPWYGDRSAEAVPWRTGSSQRQRAKRFRHRFLQIQTVDLLYPDTTCLGLPGRTAV